MIESIAIILVIFSILLAIFWFWFYWMEKTYCQRFYEQGLYDYEQEKYAKAKTSFLKVEAKNPAYADLVQYLGNTFYKLEEYSNAKKYFEQMLKGATKDFTLLYSMGFILQNLKEYSKAEEYYKKASEVDADSLDCTLNLAISQYEQEKYQEALETCEKGKEKFPFDVKILFYINRCKEAFLDTENEEQSEEIVNEYIKLSNFPEFPPEYNKILAGFYAKMGKIDLMVERCQKMIKNNPEDIDSYKFLGLAALIKRDFKEAKNTLETALHFEPWNKEIHNIMSYIVCQEEQGCQHGECRENYLELIKKFISLR